MTSCRYASPSAAVPDMPPVALQSVFPEPPKLVKLGQTMCAGGGASWEEVCLVKYNLILICSHFLGRSFIPPLCKHHGVAKIVSRVVECVPGAASVAVGRRGRSARTEADI